MDVTQGVVSILNLVVLGVLNVYLWWYIPRMYKRINAKNKAILDELEAKRNANS